MAASGNYTLALTVNDMALDCFSLLQAVGDGESLSGEHEADFKRQGNILLKRWQSTGAHLWTKTEGTLFLSVGQYEYDLRDSSVKKSNDWFETATTAATLANALTFPVKSDSDIQENDTIGIIQNDGDIFWTTVFNIYSNTVTVNDKIPLPTLSGAFVRNYRDTFKPISRIQGRTSIRRRETSDYEIPIINSSREEYFSLPNKSVKGAVIQAYYDRQDVAGESGGIMRVWNAPESSNPVINFSYERKIQMMTAATETVDIPDYAQDAFIFNVAKRLMLKYGCSSERAARINAEAMILEQNMLSFDIPTQPIKVKMRRA